MTTYSPSELSAMTPEQLKKLMLPELRIVADDLNIDYKGRKLKKADLLDEVIDAVADLEVDDDEEEDDDELEADDELDDEEEEDDEEDDEPAPSPARKRGAAAREGVLKVLSKSGDHPAEVEDDDELDDEELDDIEPEPTPKPTRKARVAAKADPAGTKAAPPEPTGDTLTAKQVATRINTDAKTLRKFFRSEVSTVEAVGQGGRYEFAKEDLPKIKAEFEKWSTSKPVRAPRSAKKTESRITTPTDDPDELEVEEPTLDTELDLDDDEELDLDDDELDDEEED